MVRAMALEKCFENSPYLPSFEALTRSRHSGLARARISSSVFSMMFTEDSTAAMLFLVHEVIAGRLLHRVLARLRIAAGNREHVPVRVIHLHGVAAVVVAGPAGLLAEEGVVRDALRRAMAMLQF